MARSDPAPALCLWLAHVSRALPPHHPRTERSLARVACALHALEGRFPRLLSLEDILMGCFLHWTATGAHRAWGLSAMQRVPPHLAVSGPALHEFPSCRYGAVAPLSPPPPPLEGGRATLPGRPRVSAPLVAGYPPRPPRRSRCSAGLASAPQRLVLLVEGWDDEAEGSGPWGGWHPQRHRQVPPPGRHVRRRAPGPACGRRRVAGLHPVGVAVWYAVTRAPQSPQPPPQHRSPRAGDDANAHDPRTLMEAWW